jgi:hypothetical protein
LQPLLLCLLLLLPHDIGVSQLTLAEVIVVALIVLLCTLPSALSVDVSLIASSHISLLRITIIILGKLKL